MNRLVMSKQLIAKTKNEIPVYADLKNSHAATHIKAHPEILEYLKEILPEVEITEGSLRFEKDMGRIIGEMDLVETTAGDDIFYVRRPNRDKYTRFVRNKNPIPTNYITIELRRNELGEYDLFTAFIGRITPSFPSGKDDRNERNREFWKNHALVYGRQEIIPGTETLECPW